MAKIVTVPGFDFQVILEDLPKEFADALNEYNQKVNEIFHQYLITVADQVTQKKGRERKLPLAMPSIGETWELCLISGSVLFALAVIFMPVKSNLNIIIILTTTTTTNMMMMTMRTYLQIKKKHSHPNISFPLVKISMAKTNELDRPN